MNELTEEQHARNWELLWDLRRNVRYFAKRAGWFDAVHRLSCLLCFIGGSGAFAAFAGNWPTAGYVCSGFIVLLSAVCAQYDYPKKAALCRSLRTDYLRLLEKAEAAGGLDMPEADCRRLAAAYRRVERTSVFPFPAALGPMRCGSATRETPAYVNPTAARAAIAARSTPFAEDAAASATGAGETAGAPPPAHPKSRNGKRRNKRMAVMGQQYRQNR